MITSKSMNIFGNISEKYRLIYLFLFFTVMNVYTGQNIFSDNLNIKLEFKMSSLLEVFKV